MSVGIDIERQNLGAQGEQPIYRGLGAPFVNCFERVGKACNNYRRTIIFYLFGLTMSQYGAGRYIFLIKNMGKDPSQDCSNCRIESQAVLGVIVLSLSLSAMICNAMCFQCSFDRKTKNIFCAGGVCSIGALIFNATLITMYAMSCSKLSCN